MSPKRGSYVFLPNEADVIAVCDFRLMLEMQALQRARQLQKNELLSALAQVIADMEQAIESQDARRYSRCDSQFHRCFFEHSGNPYLNHAYTLISGRVAALRTTLSKQFIDAQQVSMQQHRDIIRHFENDDMAALHGVLSPHVNRTIEAYRLAKLSGAFLD